LATQRQSTAPGRIATAARLTFICSENSGENIVTARYLILAVTIAAATASPALATAAAPAAAPKTVAPKPAAQALTRAAMTNQLDKTFKAIDTNGDGTVTAAEIGAAELKVLQQRAGAARTRMDAEFGKLDTNHDGQLSKVEFMAASPQAPTAAPNGATLLARLDKNKDGKVTVDEYRAPQLAAFDRLDTNHDGTISATERQAAMARR
jgi:Ca2+-binding EF-hand superfamily protein